MGAVTILRKNICERWEEENISDEDRKILKENIVPAMTQVTDLTIMDSLEECIHHIAYEDYPQEWPGVLEQVGERIVSDDAQVQYSSLLALKAIVRKYQNTLGAERSHLLDITRNCFEILENLFEKHLESFNSTSVLIMTVLTKIFFYSNYVVVFA